MNKRTVSLVCVALALACAYLAFFTDLRKRKEIHIFPENSRRAFLRHNTTPTIAFHLDKSYPLTSIEVVACEEARTNKYPHALWHLVATNQPVPTTGFIYGANVRGMKPAISNTHAEILQADTKYFLRVEAPHIKGEITFVPPS
jgi:hypothetical protein